MNKTERLTRELLSLYDGIMQNEENLPEWAVRKRQQPAERVKCTIPFVGKKYSLQKNKILVYASAENLSGYYLGNDKEWKGDWLDNDIQATNRHRFCFECTNLQGPFFPHVHLQPMNNGCLSTAVYYIANKLLNISSTSPRDFYETIAFGNYGKFSVETAFQRSMRLGATINKEKSNIDYAKKADLLKASHDFIRADINVLSPNYIILPSTIYQRDKTFIDSIKGDSVIIPIYQMNAGVINRHISKRFPPYETDALPKSVRLWYDALEQDGMTGKSKNHYLSVFSYLNLFSECYF